MEKKIQELIDFALGVVREIWSERGEVAPIALIGTLHPFEWGIAALDATSDEAKDYSSEVIKDLVKKHQANFVVFVAESWAVVLNDEERRQQTRMGRPSEHPRREEIVMISVESILGNVQVTLPITRDAAGKGTLGHPEIVPGTKTEGRFAGFLGDRPLVN